jgi:hypothetical protein
MVSPTKAYWIRFIQDGIAVVRMLQAPTEIKGPDGEVLFGYDEIEIETDESNLGLIGKNFDALWDNRKLKNERIQNPVGLADARLSRKMVSKQLFAEVADKLPEDFMPVGDIE